VFIVDASEIAVADGDEIRIFLVEGDGSDCSRDLVVFEKAGAVVGKELFGAEGLFDNCWSF